MKTQASATLSLIKNRTKRPSVRKRLFISSAVLGLLALATGVVKANDLFNDKLDDISVSSQQSPTPTGWIVDANLSISGTSQDGASSETFANVKGPGATTTGLFFKAFKGSVGFPANDLLTVNFYQDNPTTPGTKVTLSAYAAAEVNYCGRYNTNSPVPQTLLVVEFLDAFNTVLVTNTYDLAAAGLPLGTGSAATLFTTPQFTAPAGSVTVRAGASMVNAYANPTNTSPQQAFIVDALDLETVPPPGSPVITNQPAITTVAAGANTTLKVGVSNPTGVTYQWQLYGTNLVNGGNVSGATNSTLTITGVTTNNVGHYRVRASNLVGTAISTDTTLSIVGINITPVVLTP